MDDSPGRMSSSFAYLRICSETCVPCFILMIARQQSLVSDNVLKA